MMTRFVPALVLVGVVGCMQPAGRLQPTLQPVMYPLPPASPRIAYLGGIDDLAMTGQQPGRMARFLFGHDSASPRTIGKPFGLAAGDRTLLVCDTQQNVVHVVDFNQGRIDTMGGSGRGRLLKPVAVALDDQGNRYVADTLRQEVVVFSSDNEPLRALRPPGDSPFKPVAVALHAGKLYVVNGAMHRVEVLDPETGRLTRSFGEKGRGPGQMLFPSGLGVAADGHVYVTDLLNCRVEVFTAEGQPAGGFGRPGDRAGELARPKHLAIGPDGIIFVVDAAFQRVQMFDNTGRVLMLFGGPGTEPGSMMLPAGICTDRTLLPHFADRMPEGFHPDYLIFVSDQFGLRKVGVYAFGSADATGQPQR